MRTCRNCNASPELVSNDGYTWLEPDLCSRPDCALLKGSTSRGAQSPALPAKLDDYLRIGLPARTAAFLLELDAMPVRERFVSMAVIAGRLTAELRMGGVSMAEAAASIERAAAEQAADVMGDNVGQVAPPPARRPSRKGPNLKAVPPGGKPPDTGDPKP